jgi:hypothetical protein
MSEKFDAFIAEVRNMPGFVAAAAADPKWIGELESIERALHTVDRQADNSPAMLDALDRIQDVISRTDLSLKERLLEVGRLLTTVRDAIKITH